MTLPRQSLIVTADLYDLHHEAVAVIDMQFRSFGRLSTFFGPCATLAVFEDHTPVLALLSTPGEGRILAVDAGGSLRVGVMGDRLAAIGVANGWRGVVVAGAIRDSLGIDALDLGVRALGTTARRGWGANPSKVATTLRIGGAELREGDWLYADRDAVLVAREMLPIA